ncbi:MAG: hypothetical protein KGO82_10400 [Bacteroidota bacterium]|nr:hypothetical protein [Bacteroidota bacterium]
MNHASFPAVRYDDAMKACEQRLQDRTRRKSMISWGRLLTVAVLLLFVYFSWNNWQWYSWLLTIALIAIFIRLVILAVNNQSMLQNEQRLLQLHQDEIKIAGGDFMSFPNGAAFAKPGHPYSNDLDIFGQASLYQYINRCRSDQGAAVLANWLSSPADAVTIQRRQEAVRELGPMLDWRQQLQAYGIEEPVRMTTEQKITDWMRGTDEFSSKRSWQFIRFAWPVCSIGILLAFLLDRISIAGFSGFYLIALVFSGYLLKRMRQTQQSLDKIVPDVATLRNVVRCIEGVSFQSAALQSLQQTLRGNEPASQAIDGLKKILDQFDYNLNFLFLLLINPFLLWNLQTAFALEQWRRNRGKNIAGWFSVVGETEALCSLGAVHFNHPHWTFPEIIKDQHGLVEMQAAGHPLIAETKSVLNDFHTKGQSQVALITGSNMAGKSTFLRSIGVNMVLTMTGSPVLAKTFRCSVMQVSSSMRVADNLQESTSTFYAELKRLKAIIEQVKAHEPVLVLLDEILRGTNSLDRHTGSAALIRLLIKENAVALLATHDVELASMEKEYPSQLHNYHFDAQIEGEELFFDYKLKHGVCQSINASLLMRKIGIEV